MSTWLGIDFSGNHLMWRRGCGRSNVWVAIVEGSEGKCRLRDLRVVQDLPGDGPPFDRLVALLAKGDFEAAGIDAPFSLPAAYMPGDHMTLLEAVGRCPCSDRPFPRAQDLLAAVAPKLPPKGLKLYRETEELWRRQGVNTRSTLWAGARGGAAMTSACLQLLHRVSGPVWPWAVAKRPGLLVEAFPAAQLKVWGLPHQKYGRRDASQRANRKAIVTGLEPRIDIGTYRDQLTGSPDALDAVVAAFAGIAVTHNCQTVDPRAQAVVEGWIAVHRK